MKMDLQSYIMINKSILEKEICEKTVFEIESKNWSQHTYTASLNTQARPVNGEKELDVTWDYVSTKEHIQKKVWDSYLNYVNELNFSWFSSWNGFTAVRFNRYKEGQIMSIHCDHIWSIFDGSRKGIPTLTALGCLNEDYEGGELVMFDDYNIKMNTGDIMVFPSNFLYPHKVLSVTNGIRYSFVCWAW